MRIRMPTANTPRPLSSRAANSPPFLSLRLVDQFQTDPLSRSPCPACPRRRVRHLPCLGAGEAGSAPAGAGTVERGGPRRPMGAPAWPAGSYGPEVRRMPCGTGEGPRRSARCCCPRRRGCTGDRIGADVAGPDRRPRAPPHALRARRLPLLTAGRGTYRRWYGRAGVRPGHGMALRQPPRNGCRAHGGDVRRRTMAGCALRTRARGGGSRPTFST